MQVVSAVFAHTNEPPKFWAKTMTRRKQSVLLSISHPWGWGLRSYGDYVAVATQGTF